MHSTSTAAGSRPLSPAQLAMGLLLFAMLPALSQAVGVASRSASAQLPANFELDLVFPRNDTYPPVFPFPIVFAFQNVTAAWPFGMSLHWTLSPADLNNGSIDAGSKTFGSLVDTSYGTSGAFAGPDPYLWVQATNAMANLTINRILLQWVFTMHPNCSIPQNGTEGADVVRDPKDFQSLGFGDHGGIIFIIDGSAPPLDTRTIEGSSCPEPLVTLALQTSLNYSSYLSSDHGYIPRCFVLDAKNPHPQSNACAAKITPEWAANISASMLEYAHCPVNGTWPTKNLTDFCPIEAKKGTARRHAVSMSVTAWAALVLASSTWVGGW